MMRAPNSLANLTACVSPAREQSEKSTGTKILWTVRCRFFTREVADVFIFPFIGNRHSLVSGSVGYGFRPRFSSFGKNQSFFVLTFAAHAKKCAVNDKYR